MKELSRSQLPSPFPVDNGLSLRVDLQPRQAHVKARSRPCLPEVPDRPAGPMKHVLSDAIRLSVLSRDHTILSPTFDDPTEVAFDRDRAPPTVLRVLWPQPDHTRIAIDVRPA